MFCYGVTRFAAKNVFQTRLGASFVAEPNEKRLGVADSPAGKGIDVNISLVPRRNRHWQAVPFQKSFIDPVDLLNDRELEVQPRLRDWFTNRFAELRDDDLFRLKNGEEAPEQNSQKNEREHDREEGQAAARVHLFSSPLLSGKMGSRFRIVSSIMIFSPTAGRTSPMVSR